MTRELECSLGRRPAWAPPESTLLVEIRSGIGDRALVVSLCASCGAEIAREQTDVSRALVAGDRVGDRRLEDRLAGLAVLRLPVRRCGCGQPLPGPFVTSRTELLED